MKGLFLKENGFNNYMEEIWKDIINHQNYQISNFGNVRNKHTNTLVKQFNSGKDYKSSNSYKAVCINSKTLLVHRLVAKYFVYNDNPKDKIYVNHKDELKYNNVYTNLEWCTNKYNCNYGNRNNIVANKLSHNKVIQYDNNGNIIKVWNSKEEIGRKFGFGITSALRRNTFNRYFKKYYWFYDFEDFNKNRYKPIKYYNFYKENELIAKRLTLGEIAKIVDTSPQNLRNKYNRYKIIYHGLYKIIENNE